MGNKSSKADLDPKQQRNGKKKGNKKLERAFSDSDIPSMRQKNPNKNNNARPQSMNPAAFEEQGSSTNVQQEQQKQLEKLQQQQKQLQQLQANDMIERDKISRRFNNSLQDLLRVWPEYGSLERIDIEKVSIEGLETLQKVFTRLTEQYEYIKSLSREKHDLNNEVDELREETLSQKQRLKECENNLERYADNIAVLKGELRRRGIDPKVETLNPYDRVADNDRYNDFSDGSDSGMPPAQTTKEKFAKAGLVPTPIVQMSHNRDTTKVENLIKRSASLRKGATQDENRLVEELNEKLRRLNLDLEKAKTERDTYLLKLEDMEKDDRGAVRGYDRTDNDYDSREIQRLKNELEREQKANQQLKERLDNLGNKPRFAVDRKSVVDSIVQSFEDLKAQATGPKLQDAFEKSNGRVTSDRRGQFFCAIMEESYAQAGKLVRSMMANIKELLVDPTQSTSVSGSKGSKAPPLSAGPQINRQRNFSFNRSTTARSSSNATRPSVIGADIPRDLMQDIGDYVESIADRFDPASMTEAVIDILSREFRDCITPALMNHNQFSTFLHQCCALAWRMCIAAPPLYLVSSINDPDSTVDRKLHDINTINLERTVNQIDYYLWPVLFTRKNGMVLIRGTVVLQKA